VHAWQVRHLSDLPVAGRRMVVELRVRRLVCAEEACPQRTFREQVPLLAARYARRTVRLSGMIGQIAVRLAGRAGSAVLGLLGVAVSRSTVLRTPMALPLPTAPVPPVLSVDDVALCRGRRYMTMVIDPVTHRRVEVLPDRRAATLADWLRDRPGVQVVCRDGSAAYAEAIGDGAPGAVQVSDRWHLWHGLGAAVEKTVIAHSGCWRPDPDTDGSRSVPATAAQPARIRQKRALAERTRTRHAEVHRLLGQGVGLLECARRLGWAMNTVKRYARAATAEDLVRPPRFGPTLVDPYRDHLRQRLALDPNVPTTRLLAEIREQGYPGSANLLVRYLSQGRADTERIVPAPRRLVSWIMTRPAQLPERERTHLDDLLSSCPHLTALVDHVRRFAALLTQRRGDELHAWMSGVDDTDLPALHTFVRGLRKGPVRRHRRADPALQQRPHRGSEHQGQTIETTDVRASGLPATAPTHPAQLTRRTTASVPEPLFLQSQLRLEY
jgi:hypothetical protein